MGFRPWQTVLIDDLDRGVDQTKDALVSQQTRLKRLLKQSRDNWKFFCVIGAPAHQQPRAPPPCSHNPLRLRGQFAVLVVIVLGVILYLIFTQGN